jgi:UDP-N-acetylglucosamine 2-epimerase (non-hydrolysing)
MRFGHPRERSMKKVMTVFGTRPEAIKMAPLINELQADNSLEPIVAVTGQHREMLDQVNSLFGIVPEHDLDIMVPGATLTDISTRTLAATSRLFEVARPDAVVVQGDTSSAFMAALAAFYQGIPVVHLEAGLRTGNMKAPFPEEANRRLVAPLAELHLAPTPQARANLLQEAIPESSIVVTGNTVIDALHWAITVEPAFADARVEPTLSSSDRVLLVTAHRRESWGEPMREAMEAIRGIAQRHPNLSILLPMHRNSIVRDVIEPLLGGAKNVLLTEPLTYHEFAHAMRAATLVLTDSGGVQEEAPSLGKPVLVMRETTERPEGLAAGTVRLVGTSRQLIGDAVNTLLEDEVAYRTMANAANPYGDGAAAERAVSAIRHLFGLGERLPDFVPAGGSPSTVRSSA